MDPKLCPVCLRAGAGSDIVQAHRNISERVAWDMCEAHKKLYDDGFVALIEARDTSVKQANGTVKATDAVRTGRVCHITQDTAVYLFGMGFDPNVPLVFCVPGVIDNINNLVAENMRRKQQQELKNGKSN